MSQPTTAQRFVDDTAARRSLICHDLPIPPQLDQEAIKNRYMPLRMLRDLRGDHEVVTLEFPDGSSASVIAGQGRWEESHV